MLRSAACALLVSILLSGSLMAQRGGGVSRGSMTVAPGRSPSAPFRGSISQRPFARDHFHRNRAGFLYPYLFPYDEPYGYEGPYTEVVEKEPAPVAAQPAAPPQPTPQPQVIEVPAGAEQTPTKPLPPTIFILTNGERLESKRFLLRANDVSITLNRRQRTIPLDQLDLDATITANRDRGIELEIPADPNEISLRF